MAELAFKQMIATFIRQTRPQTFRHGKPPRYPQRLLATAAATQPGSVRERERDHKKVEWQAHHITPANSQQSLTSGTRLENLRNETEPRSFSSFLTDNYSREHNYLRISLTERCNLRCLYCMPEEGIQLSPPDHILTTPEIVYLSSLFVGQGVNKIRLTGGEPTVRKDILDLMHQIGQLRSSGLKELCLTTNGISLSRKLDSMLAAGLTGVNLSLDTLDPFQFTIMTRRNGHEAVMKSIDRILEMNKLGAGIKLKINCVVMRGLNDKEITSFVELGRYKDLEVRFIEYMPFEGNKWSQNKMLSFRDMLAQIREKYPDVYKVQDHANDTSKTYKVPGFAGRIGFITSMTHNFCGTCNRLRITSDGNLKVCLFGNSEVSLRDILRESNDGKPIDAEAMEAIKQVELDQKAALRTGSRTFAISDRESKLLNVIGAAVKRKEAKHAGLGELENMKNRPMILIDDFLRAPADHTAYQRQSPFKVSSPLLSIRSSTAFSSSISTHLLSHGSQPSIFQQHRYRSTFLLRRTYITKKPLARFIFNIPTHRRVETGPLPQWLSKEHADRKRKFEKAFFRAAGHVEMRRMLSVAKPRFVKFKLRPGTTLSHLRSSGEAHMVDVGHKNETHRSATAMCHLLFSTPITYEAITDANLKKGDAMAVARVASIQAAKKTADLIPLAHPGLGITAVVVDIDVFPSSNNESNRAVPVATSAESVSDDSKSTSNEAPMNSRHGGVRVTATVQCYGKTGVEMEALTAANVGILTMYDMLKAVDKSMLITNSRVIEKTGGKSGSWKWNKKEHKIERIDDPSVTTKKEVEDSEPEARPANVLETRDVLDHSSLPQFASAFASATGPADVDAAEDSAQSILEAEWQELSKSFTPPATSAGHDSSTSSDQHMRIVREGEFSSESRRSRIDKDMYSGFTNGAIDSASFARARMERYDEWKKNQ